MLAPNNSLFESLITFPVQVKGYWNSKIVTTEPPKYIPHTEYSFECELLAETPVLVVLFLKSDNVLHFQKFGRSAASPNINIHLSFFPYDWNNSSQVQISLYQQVISQGGGLQLAINSESLKQDPRQLVDVDLFSSGIINTGQIINLASIRLSYSIVAQFLVIPVSETESVHGRWRLKKAISAELPSSLSFLTQGRCIGQMPLQ